MTSEYLLTIARDTIDMQRYCFLITLSESGQANARLVQHFKPEADNLVLHKFKNPAKCVMAIKSHITVTFQDDRTRLRDGSRVQLV